MKLSNTALVWASLTLGVAACNRSEAPAEREQSEEPGAEDAAGGRPGNHSNSIIREDVLVETDTVAEPKSEPINLTLDFSESSGELTEGATAKLDAMLEAALVTQGGCITVRGHTDSRGSDLQNLKASQKRAEVVRDYLADRGIDAGRVTIITLGERRPIAPNANLDGSDNPEGRAKNRRVTVEVKLPQGGQCSGTIKR